MATVEERAEKNRENRLRRMASRAGLRLRKSLARNPLTPGYRKYMLASIEANAAQFGLNPGGWYEADLEAIEECLVEGLLDETAEEQAESAQKPPEGESVR